MPINKYISFDAAKQVGQETGNPIVHDLYASWCANYFEFIKESSRNDLLNQTLIYTALVLDAN
jgi:hypothetical protein